MRTTSVFATITAGITAGFIAGAAGAEESLDLTEELYHIEPKIWTTAWQDFAAGWQGMLADAANHTDHNSETVYTMETACDLFGACSSKLVVSHGGETILEIVNSCAKGFVLTQSFGKHGFPVTSLRCQVKQPGA